MKIYKFKQGIYIASYKGLIMPGRSFTEAMMKLTRILI